jgi:cysteinyl-tRNA synthetase
VPLRVFDSLTRRKVDFEPLVPGQVSMYLCGPTVQDAPHIGHARSAMAFDVIRRYLRWTGWKVTYARNFTDIDDKIISKAKERGWTAREHAEHYAAIYQREMAAVGNDTPDVEPKVTETMPEIVAFIARLVDAGKAYASNGDVYFSVASFPPYGALSGQSTDDLCSGARIEVDEDKRNPLDFALWKAQKPGEPAWDSPWGPGRPGWHIECSAMIEKVFGQTIDIHGGGRDLVFPHHENELAQSQAALGPNTFVRYWLHNGLLNLGEKMSKSLGNVLLVEDMRRHYVGESLRYYLVQFHYRAPINFEIEKHEDGTRTFHGIDTADRRLDYLYTTLQRLDDFLGAKRDVDDGPTLPDSADLVAKVREAMDDDFNTAIVVAELGEAAKAANKLLDDPKSAPKDVRRRTLARLRRDLVDVGVGALGVLGRPPAEFLAERRGKLCERRRIDATQIDGRLAERDAARKAKDYARADEIRGELRQLGVEIMDTPRGAEWRVIES